MSHVPAPLLEVNSLGFRYRDRDILSGIDLSLHAGTCSALAGPNGAGKTTLLRLIAGTLEPSCGTIQIDGVRCSTLSRRQRSRIVALVPQELDIPFNYTVQQVVEQGRTPHLGLLGTLTREDRRAVERALDLADVARLRQRIVNELSGGERQRVKIALGLAQEPRLLLLDEPTQNLDIGRQAELMSLLSHLRTEGITLLASMHDLNLVFDNFAEVHLLPAGRPLLSGAPAKVLTPENLLSAFVCAPGRHPLLQTELLQEVV